MSEDTHGHQKCVQGTGSVMMTPGRGSDFRISGPWCGESIGDRWIPLTKGQ